MAWRYIQSGDVLTVTSPSGGVATGDGVQIGEMFGIATHDAAEGDELELARTGVFSINHASGDTFTVGAPVYWDSTAGEVVDTAGTDKEIGFATAAQSGGRVNVCLVPTVRVSAAA